MGGSLLVQRQSLLVQVDLICMSSSAAAAAFHSTFKAKSRAGMDWYNTWKQFGCDNEKLKTAWLNELTCFSIASALFMTYAYAVLATGTNDFAEDVDAQLAATAVVVSNSLCGTFSLLCVVVGSNQYVTSNKLDAEHTLNHINNMYDRRGLSKLLVITDPWLAFSIAVIFLYASVIANAYAFYGFQYAIMSGSASLLGFILWIVRLIHEYLVYSETLSSSLAAAPAS